MPLISLVVIGPNYTSPVFQKLMKSYGLKLSMFGHGNCWDNGCTPYAFSG